MDGLNDPARSRIIISELTKYAKDEIELDLKACEHFENRNKAIICDANVVVYFDLKDNRLVMIGGDEMPPRAS